MNKTSLANIELRVSRKLQKYYEVLWKPQAEKAKQIIESLIPFKIINIIENIASFKPWSFESSYYQDGFSLVWNFDDNGQIYSEVDKYRELLNKQSFPEHFMFSSFGKSTNSNITFSYHPDYENLREQFREEMKMQEKKEIEKKQEYKTKKEKELINITKSEALEKATQDIIDGRVAIWKKDDPKDSTGNNYYTRYERKDVELIAQHWGLNPDELENYAFKQPEVLEKHKEEKNRREKLIRITVSRLPRFIAKVVNDVPVRILEHKTGTSSGYYKRSTGIVVYIHSHSGLADLMETLAHEYWHAFEAISGFKHKSYDYFNKIVEDIGLGYGAMDDFKKVVQILDLYGGEDFSKQLQDFERRWGKKYLENRDYDLLEDVQFSLKQPQLYQTMSEMLAETLKDIVMNENKSAPSQSIIVWMNKKFSSRNNDEFIIESVIKRCPKKYQDDRPKSEQQWCLFTKDEKKLLGRHPTKEKALAQERAVQIHKHK